jgi:hypothetical protein
MDWMADSSSGTVAVLDGDSDGVVESILFGERSSGTLVVL